ncbi:MAG TPA: HAMP domain-containing sensor histidine kinase [Planctomycetota bacterium]|nr:HAMP domain-containing sensor histidine kinase [Planctomycetota bacterium]
MSAQDARGARRCTAVVPIEAVESRPSLEPLRRAVEREDAAALDEIAGDPSEVGALAALLRDQVRRKRELLEMLATLSHEIRNPLHAVLGNASCLLEGAIGPLDARQTVCVEDIREAGKHLLWLSDQTLDVSKIEAKRDALDRAPVDSHDLLDVSVRLVRDRAARKGIAIEVDEPPGVLPTLLGDGRRLEQALVNLLVNAVKYTPAPGRVVAGVRVGGGHAAFFVADNGIGIDPADQARLFRPFERAAEEIEGSGLGLALSRRIIELHGGQITVASEKRRGSLFAFRLPLVPAVAPEPKEDAGSTDDRD